MRQLCDGEDVDKVEEQLEVRRPPLTLRWPQEPDIGDDRDWGLATGCHPQSMEPECHSEMLEDSRLTGRSRARTRHVPLDRRWSTVDRLDTADRADGVRNAPRSAV